MKNERIKFIDLARGFAILFMIMVHVLSSLSSEGVYESWFGEVVDFLGSPPAAPVFMFLMGTSMMFSRSVDLKKGISRGLKLLGLAYLLNVLRSIMPTLLFEDYDSNYYITEFFVIDILQFSGLAIIILSFVRKYIKKPLVWIGMGIVIAFVSPFIWGKMSGNPVLDWLLTLLWGLGGENVAFPVLPWLSFPLFGMAFGYWLKQSEDKSKFVKKTGIVGAIIMIPTSVLVLANYDFHISDYWRMGYGGIFWMTGFVLVELYIVDLLVKHCPENKFFNLLYYWSTRVTVLYVLHWIIIGWLSLVIKVNTILLSSLMMVVIIIISHMVTWMWSDQLVQYFKSKKMRA